MLDLGINNNTKGNMAKIQRSQKSADDQNRRSRNIYDTHFGTLKELLKGKDCVCDTNVPNDDPRLLYDYYSICVRKDYPYYVYVVICDYIIEHCIDQGEFIGALMYANIIGDTEVAKFVFAQCKYRVNRKCALNSLDRFDGFWCHLASDTLVYRHQGTTEGGLLFGKISDPEVREFNKAALRTLQHGVGNAHQSLICHITGRDVENIKRYNAEEDAWIDIMSYELHHASYIENQSYYYNVDTDLLDRKEMSPSALLNAYRYTKFTSKHWLELLGCVVMDSSEHGMLHKITKHGGPAYWVKCKNLAFYHSIPYAWQSEANYIEIVNWICSVCPHVDTLDFPIWQNLMDQLNSLLPLS
jgi:hypothetical protein